MFKAPSMTVHYRLLRFRNLGCFGRNFLSSLNFTREKTLYEIVLEYLIALLGSINLGMI